jgi:hypothetical protein
MKTKLFTMATILMVALFFVGMASAAPASVAPSVLAPIISGQEVCYTYTTPTETTTYECPSRTFSASRSVCPEDAGAYVSTDSSKDCKMKFGSGRDQYFLYADEVTETFGPILVQYEKSQDPNHCHKPTGPSLGVPSWAADDFNTLPNQLGSIIVNTVLTCPNGYDLDGNTCKKQISCENPVDVCSNIEGNQATVPDGYHANGDGTCSQDENPVDVCSNIEGNQATVPAGYHANEDGTCSIDPVVTETPGPGGLSPCAYVAEQTAAGADLSNPGPVLQKAMDKCSSKAGIANWFANLWAKLFGR